MPHGSLGKGSGTPKNLARSHVLVAKVLTNSDAHGRIILPRVSVEANLTFLMGYRQVQTFYGFLLWQDFFVVLNKQQIIPFVLVSLGCHMV